jgi:hypothetical protein
MIFHHHVVFAVMFRRGLLGGGAMASILHASNRPSATPAGRPRGLVKFRGWDSDISKGLRRITPLAISK